MVSSPIKRNSTSLLISFSELYSVHQRRVIKLFDSIYFIIWWYDRFFERNGLFSLTKFLTNTTDPERKEKCLKTFQNASIFDDETCKIKISDEGLIDILIDFIQNDAENSLEIRECCFQILSNLCKNCLKNKKLFRKKGGIDLIIQSLKDQNIGISTRYALFAMAVLDSLWNGILGNKKNETYFLENEV